MRDFFIDNALYWLDEFHFDGLRLDAVHAIRDHSTPHFLDELAATVRQRCASGRHVHLILENDDNAAAFLARDADGAALRYTAQWNDDIHHSLHTCLTGESDGYYVDYADAPLEHLGRCLTAGFAYQGEHSRLRRRARGSSTAGLPLSAFVSFLQNHDQVGNRAFGERLTLLAEPAALAAAVAIVLLAPSPPLLFMGEEFGATTPFLYFCDFDPPLAAAVRAGRLKEFARFARFSDAASAAAIPDPQSPETFAQSKLDWDSSTRAEHASWLERYRELLRVRRDVVIPMLAKIDPRRCGFAITGARSLAAHWSTDNGARLLLFANLGGVPDGGPALPPGTLVYTTGDTAAQALSFAVVDDLAAGRRPDRGDRAMREPATLERLCERYGIAAGYEDAWGASRRTPEETKLALLRAMGIDVGAAANDASGAESDAGANGASAPAIVVDERAGRVPLRLGLSSATTASVDWRIDLETGESVEGVATPATVAGGDGRSALEIPLPQAIGYHTLTIRDQATRALLASSRLIVTPSRCYNPPLLAGGARIWGLALQLYALRSHRNWGIGDFTDLRNAVRVAAAAGADFVGTNPLHALFPARPEAASPYSPSNRAALNVLYIDVEAVDDFIDCKAARARVYSPAFQSALARLRAFDHVDYAGGRTIEIRDTRAAVRSLPRASARRQSRRARPRVPRFSARPRAGAEAARAVRRAARACRGDHRRSRRLAELAGRVSPAVGHRRRRALSPPRRSRRVFPVPAVAGRAATRRRQRTGAR